MGKGRRVFVFADDDSTRIVSTSRVKPDSFCPALRARRRPQNCFRPASGGHYRRQLLNFLTSPRPCIPYYYTHIDILADLLYAFKSDSYTINVCKTFRSQSRLAVAHTAAFTYPAQYRSSPTGIRSFFPSTYDAVPRTRRVYTAGHCSCELYTDLYSRSFKFLDHVIDPPISAQAVSVSLPTWASNIGYEEGEKWVVNRMTTGYPR